MHFAIRAIPARRLIAAVLLASVAGCGGGDFVESLVKLITARFVPASVTLGSGASIGAELEVSCDRNGLNTSFGRLGVRVKLDPSLTLANGVTASFASGGPPDSEGFQLFSCTGATNDPDLMIAHIPVVVTVKIGTVPMTTVLRAFIEVEPLVSGEPSKDSTLAELSVRITGEATTPGS